ncbi:hypothetical protein JHK84_040036 [Glycine max]|nr:hypothetical protein JHK84_040036 [Glycine max]
MGSLILSVVSWMKIDKVLAFLTMLVRARGGAATTFEKSLEATPEPPTLVADTTSPQQAADPSTPEDQTTPVMPPNASPITTLVVHFTDKEDSNTQECNLYQLMKDREKLFSKAEVRNWCFQVFQGLGYMHQCGYFHRDLKLDSFRTLATTLTLSTLSWMTLTLTWDAAVATVYVFHFRDRGSNMKTKLWSLKKFYLFTCPTP